jgi:hypothetical protein
LGLGIGSGARSAVDATVARAGELTATTASAKGETLKALPSGSVSLELSPRPPVEWELLLSFMENRAMWKKTTMAQQLGALALSM